MLTPSVRYIIKVMEEESTKKPKNKAASELGKLSAEARKKKQGKDFMKDVSKKGNEAQWGTRKRVIHK